MKVFDQQRFREALAELAKPQTAPDSRRDIIGYRTHRFWLVGTLIMTVVCSLLHLATYFVPAGFLSPALGPLALLSFSVFVAAVILSGFCRRDRDAARRDGPFASLSCSFEEGSLVVRKTPRGVRIVVLLVGGYCALIFAAHMRFAAEGRPFEDNGKYVLMHRWRVVRALDGEESRHREIWAVRGHSALPLFFSLLSAVGFAYHVEHRPKNGGRPRPRQG